MSFPELKGRRAVIVARCSTNEQIQSIIDQLDVCHQFAQQNGMVVVYGYKYEGVSASIETNLEAIVKELIDRKERLNDFDCILVHDSSRFSRSGARHSNKLKWELEQVGLEVIPVMEYSPASPYSDVLDTLGAAQSHEQARSISTASARGCQSSLEQGHRAHCTRRPFGTDGLILGEDGAELFILRNLRDGSQLRLDPKTGETLERFPRKVNGASGHYRKARGQRIALVPGDSDDVAIVNLIYERYYRDGYGYRRIAMELNGLRVPGPSGGLWNVRSIRNIVFNPVYTGKGLANALSNAIYSRRSAGKPTAVAKRSKKAASGQPAVIYRDPEDWVWIQNERLEGFLPEGIRELAIARQKQFLVDRAEGKASKPVKDKHLGSEFILKNVLQTSDGLKMSGRRSGRNGEYRRYARSRSDSSPVPGSPSPRIRAEAVEEPILAHLKMVLICMPHLRARVLEQTHEWNEARQRSSDRTDLEKRLTRIDRQIGIALGLESDDEEIARRLKDLLQEKKEIKMRLDADSGLPNLTGPEVEEVVDIVLENFQTLGRLMDEFDPAMLRQLVDIFVEEAVVDLETREVSFVIGIPSWAMVNDRMMGLEEPFGSKSTAEAHRFASFDLGFVIPKPWKPAA
jgi:DNA invertase Pin-like site-specific DNA recombinase